MKLHYISPSVLPSRSANSVHVVRQCEGLASIGVDVTLYTKRSVVEESCLEPLLRKTYGFELPRGQVVSYYSASSRGDNLRIAVLALWTLFRKSWPDIILSRNLYAAYVIGVLLRRPLIFETHQLESGVRKAMQCAIMICPWVTTLLISHKMLDFVERHHGKKPVRSLILHDAAPDGIVPLPPEERRRSLIRMTPQAEGAWEAVCGYFGHLYPGRGIEIIEAMAAARPQVLFLIYGGNDADVQACRRGNSLHNLHYMGYVSYPEAQQAMRAMDVLLMPYQESVSIGVKGHDTACWMSPMKMFEYLASGVPLISSDLPVLREVLRDGKNSLLAHPSRSESWLAGLDRLLADPALAQSLGAEGHQQYRREHTWTKRARRIVEAIAEQ